MLLVSAVTKRNKVLEHTMNFVKAGLESGKLTPAELTGILSIVGAIAEVLLGVGTVYNRAVTIHYTHNLI